MLGIFVFEWIAPRDFFLNVCCVVFFKYSKNLDMSKQLNVLVRVELYEDKEKTGKKSRAVGSLTSRSKWFYIDRIWA